MPVCFLIENSKDAMEALVEKKPSENQNCVSLRACTINKINQTALAKDEKTTTIHETQSNGTNSQRIEFS